LTAIKGFREILRMRLEECLTLAKDNFETAVRPIYASNAWAHPEHIGSSMLLAINDVRYLLTAAHVIDWTKRGSLYVAGQMHLIAIEAEFFITNAANRDDDPYDFAFAKLAPAMIEELGNVKYITENEICMRPGAGIGHAFMTLGYPNSKNKKIDNVKKGVPSVIWPYSTNVVNDTVLTAIAKELAVSGEDHIFIKFNKRSKAITGQIANSLKPRGIRGGALIDLGNFARMEELAKPPKVGCLVGLLIEHHAKHKAMVSTRMSIIIREINKSYAADGLG
jgi:hypothetical protein